MTFFTGGGSAFGMGRSATFDQSASRSQILGRRYQPFANPFFDQASTYTPPTVKSLFGFCRFYHSTHGVINAINTRASEYPVTDIIIQHKDRSVVDRWNDLLLGVMNYRVFQFEVNLDYYVYGNAFVSPSFPFRKLIQCASCNKEHNALESRPYWRYTNHQFWLTCSACGQVGFAKSRDEYYPKFNEIGLIRWNPENVQIFYNEATGRLDYLLDLSPDYRAQIQMGRKDLVATSPEIFLDAVKMRRSLVFDRNEVFHMRRPALSSMNRGWGMPLLMPVMKDAFYVQVMKKAQEAVLLTHLVPQIFLFPQPATAAADPFTVTNLQNWRDHIRRELARQRMDPSYYGILPFPIGHQVIGENGRSLLLMPEIRAMTEMICVGMGFPSNLVFGDGNYAGSSVSLRMLENFFISNVHAQHRLLHWVIRRFAAFLNWPAPDARFKPFRMADDLQRQAFMFQLNAAGKISDTTLLSYADLNVESEAELQVSETRFKADVVRKQQLMQADVQGEAQIVMAKAQAKAQAVMASTAAAEAAPKQDPFAIAQSSGLAGQPQGVSLDAAATALAMAIQRMPEGRKQQYLAQVQAQIPEMAQLMQQQGLPELPQVQAAGGPEQMMAGAPPGVDMRPQPEVLPPRRGP